MEKEPDEQDQSKLKELIRLSRLAKISGWVTGLFATLLLTLTIMSSGPEGMTLFGLISAVIVGFVWHRSVQLVGIGREMRHFASFEEYLNYVKDRIDKEDSE